MRQMRRPVKDFSGCGCIIVAGGRTFGVRQHSSRFRRLKLRVRTPKPRHLVVCLPVARGASREEQMGQADRRQPNRNAWDDARPVSLTTNPCRPNEALLKVTHRRYPVKSSVFPLGHQRWARTTAFSLIAVELGRGSGPAQSRTSK